MFTMTLQFERGKEDSIETLNALLLSMPLSGLDVADSDGYMRTSRSFHEDGTLVSVELGYGFDSVVLNCSREEGKQLHIWQFDAEVLSREDDGNYHDRWCEAHPDRVMRCLLQTSFDEATAFITLHHERQG